jgi:hypothetical protein
MSNGTPLEVLAGFPYNKVLEEREVGGNNHE